MLVLKPTLFRNEFKMFSWIIVALIAVCALTILGAILNGDGFEALQFCVVSVLLIGGAVFIHDNFEGLLKGSSNADSTASSSPSQSSSSSPSSSDTHSSESSVDHHGRVN